MEQKKLNALFAEINARCWDDEDFKRHFIAEPKKIFQEYEIPYSEEMEYRVLESAENESILVLPVEGAAEILLKVAEITKKNSDKQAMVLKGKKLTIVQNTEKLTYLVIKNVKAVSSDIELLDEKSKECVGSWFLSSANILAFANAVVFSNAVVATEAAAAIK